MNEKTKTKKNTSSCEEKDQKQIENREGGEKKGWGEKGFFFFFS